MKSFTLFFIENRIHCKSIHYVIARKKPKDELIHLFYFMIRSLHYQSISLIRKHIDNEKLPKQNAER